ncbi:beta-ribofuranosylaminobenzene 5'-phosphate synthase family protein [Nocardia anaemiae]|uniref:beta-ribofuranosylaminobenzene 5'-phosphate synthase family protein n=1 Tax=Nocardia anaemiae TaxID=263910 RepID=UPI0007C72E84|nr:beta-ribofuranosylaminobenzene 5'-phosphate synthase family protein [Nocardia anaemiae]
MRVQSAARLSFTLIDLNGGTGRRNGMASLSLRDPAFVATLRPAARTEVAGGDTGHTAEIASLLDALRERCGGPPVRCDIDAALPAHHGFGSKTTTLLSVAKAYAALSDTTVPTEELARLCGRGGTSGASVNLIDRGGFLVDGGHANPPDFAEDAHRYLLPSRFAGAAVRKPPPLVSLPFPPWPILVIVGAGTELHGKPELEWFRRTLPIPFEEAAITAHLVLMNLAPAIAESDYMAFCRALNRLTFETYYKQEQVRTQSDGVKHLLKEARQSPAVDAIGMSVTGPMCFAFTRTPAAAVEWISGLRHDGVVKDFYFTTAQNHAAVLAAIPILED